MTVLQTLMQQTQLDFGRMNTKVGIKKYVFLHHLQSQV